MAIETWAGLGVIGVLVGASVLAALSGVRTYRRGTAIANATPLERADDPGTLAAVGGTIVGPADGHSLESEFGGTDCVAYAAEEVEERSATPGEDVRRSPRITFDRGRDEVAVPFVVDADGRRVRVDGAGAHVHWRSVDFDEVSAGQVIRNRSGLRAIWAFLRRFAGREDRRRRYYEACLRPGDHVHVIGTAITDVAEADVAFEGGRGSPLVVASNEPSRVADAFRNRAKSTFVWAAVLLGTGVLLVLVWTGIL